MPILITYFLHKISLYLSIVYQDMKSKGIEQYTLIYVLKYPTIFTKEKPMFTSPTILYFQTREKKLNSYLTIRDPIHFTIYSLLKNNHAYEDLYLMGLYSHNIIAKSSFS